MSGYRCDHEGKSEAQSIAGNVREKIHDAIDSLAIESDGNATKTAGDLLRALDLLLVLDSLLSDIADDYDAGRVGAEVAP